MVTGQIAFGSGTAWRAIALTETADLICSFAPNHMSAVRCCQAWIDQTELFTQFSQGV